MYELEEKQQRDSWDEIEYAVRINKVVKGIVTQAAILLLEAKEKFFSGEKDKSWTKFVQEDIGISRQTAYELIVIAERVLPYLTEEQTIAYGRTKLALLARIENPDELQEAVAQCSPDLTVKEMERKLASKVPPKQKQKKFKTGQKLANMLRDFEDDLSDMLPDEEDTESVLKKKQYRIEDFRTYAGNSWDSLSNIIAFLLSKEVKTQDMFDKYLKKVGGK